MTAPLPRCRCTLPLLFALGLPAQEPARPPRDAKAITAALANIEPEAVAWAAHDARILGDKSLIAPLNKTLTRLRDDKDALVAFARLFVLDALAGFDAKVPAAELLPWLDDDRAGPVAFLLLARQSRIHEAELFELFRASWPPRSDADRVTIGTKQHPALRLQAIGNLLCEQKTPGFAAFVFENTDFDLHVKVVAPGIRVQHSYSNTTVFFGTPPGLPEGLPPVPVYTYLRTDTPGSNVCELVAPGPIGIGIARRQLAKEAPRARSGARGDANGLASPLPWLLTLAGDRPSPKTSAEIPFHGAEQYLADLVEARDGLRDYRRRLLADLVAGKALGEVDADRLGKNDVQVHTTDERKDKSVPLPELPPAK